MESTHTLGEVEKFRVDCLYGKKKHFNARDRLQNSRRCLGGWIIGFSAATSTSAFVYLADLCVGLKVITALLSVITTILAAIQKNQNFEERAQNHHVIGNRYLALQKKAQRWASYGKDGGITGEALKVELEKMSQEAVEVQSSEPDTLREDYEKARAGTESGEERYVEAEGQ